MEKNFTTFRSPQRQFLGKGLLLLLGLAFGWAPVFSQAADPSLPISAPISTDDITVKAWKAAPDYAAVVAAERTDAAQAMATPGLKQAKLALYTGYDRMLSYMQADLLAQAPIEETAAKNFQKVTLEAPNDSLLIYMEGAEFNGLYIALLVKLQQ